MPGAAEPGQEVQGACEAYKDSDIKQWHHR